MFGYSLIKTDNLRILESALEDALELTKRIHTTYTDKPWTTEQKLKSLTEEHITNEKTKLLLHKF